MHVFIIMDASINSWAASIFRKVRRKYWGLAAIFILFSSLGPCHNDIYNKPLFRFTLCSTYWMQVLIPKLHQILRKFGRIFGSWRPSFIFFVKLGPCHPDNFKATYPIYSIFNILHSSSISWNASIFIKFGKISGSWRLSLIFFCQIRTLSPW